MTDNINNKNNNKNGEHFNRVSVCPMSAKMRRMKSLEKQQKEEYITDLKKGEQVYAVKSYSDQRNNVSLTFVEGDIITLLDQFSDGMCQGFLTRLGSDSKIGLFPTTCVVPFTKNNIKSSNPINSGKTSRKFNDIKEKEKSYNSPVAIREKGKSSFRDIMPKTVIDGSHMYSCNYIEIRKSPILEVKPNLTVDSLNRGSTCSVDSGRGSTTVTMMNSIKMNIQMMLAPTFNQAQYIPENYVNQSIESGLASYQRHSSSSSSSIGGGSSIDGSKHNIGFMDNEHRQILNITLEEEEKEESIIKKWLHSIGLEIYFSNFINSGYDFNTLLRMTPEDLNAIGITNPKHRKIIKNDISNRSNTIHDNLPDHIPITVEDWLEFLNLTPYLEIILQQGYDKVEKLTDLTWEDLEEIGIKKLGHQKKIILAVEKLKKIIKFTPCDKLSMSFSAENFRDPKSKFITSDTSPNYKIKNENHSFNPAYLDLSRYHSTRPVPPIRQISQPPDISLPTRGLSLYSPAHTYKSNITDINIPPPTPKRISSIMSDSKQQNQSPQKSRIRQPYENLNESIDMLKTISNLNKNLTTVITPDSNTSQNLKTPSPTNVRFRSSSIMLMETNCIPFANENCGTIKQRSSSLDRTDILREEMEFGVFNVKSNNFSTAKPVLPLTLPYNVDSLSFKSTNSTQKFKVNIGSERDLHSIPSEMHVSIQGKVSLPKLRMEDNSSNEDFNEICDMLEDLTELLDKEVSRHH